MKISVKVRSEMVSGNEWVGQGMRHYAELPMDETAFKFKGSPLGRSSYSALGAVEDLLRRINTENGTSIGMSDVTILDPS